MNKLVINDSLSSLQRQIAVSVGRLKAKEAQNYPAEKENGEQPQADYAGARLNEKAYSLLETSVSYRMFSYTDRQIDAAYAARSYNTVAGVDKPSTVLIDFMFANNREFDFKV